MNSIIRRSGSVRSFSGISFTAKKGYQ